MLFRSDVFTRRIIGFGVAPACIDGVSVCRMFNDASAGQPRPRHLSTDLICLTSITRKLASQRWKRNSGSWSLLRCLGLGWPAEASLNIRHTDTPSIHAGTTPKQLMRRVNTSITTMTQWLRSRIDSTRNRSRLHRLSLACPMKISQDDSEGRLFPLDSPTTIAVRGE